jgi:hypothetical protein
MAGVGRQGAGAHQAGECSARDHARFVTALTSRFAQRRYDLLLVVARPWSPIKRRGWVVEGTMQYLLILLVAITMACGAAATVTISLAPAYAGDSGKGY